jgi:hypothetical protein
MAVGRDDRLLLRRLEAAVAAVVREADPVRVAFSGGLASIVIASLVRKRAEMVCIVAGTKDSPDIRASEILRDFLDYRVESVLVSRRDVERLLEDLRARSPRLTSPERGSLVPLWASRAPDPGTILAAFGSGRMRPEVRKVLADGGVALPLVVAMRGAPLLRPRLRTIAELLGVPPGLVGLARRPPARGAGIVEFLQGKDR